ncbi:hypothetical protein CEUSTIGMA_g9736.t1 [Chlamydomonas eustigma]|uniref:Uncharacterized protein n=1 Tax=Chlamydomonas eustigma TaxID=1157962 RepID=A0A250XGV7_9CHLO|nr:hypothetical protein CEUSTIGMA_g9736.t1 [Chlamydomonas eustigma]|eukprot:GAX82307.1 hypothetical protein CEUSTIGMA_g9736.t1 [Chlamydomonas eustigma]
MVKEGLGVQPIADLLEPVPEEVMPVAVRGSAASMNLFKEEFRAAQRLRSTEVVFISEVVRTTHPPELGPHSVSSHPAPSYSYPRPSSSPTRPKAVGPGPFNQPVTFGGGSRPSSPVKNGRGAPAWSETGLNKAGLDYVLRPGTTHIQDPSLKTATAGALAGPSGQRPLSPSKRNLAEKAQGMVNSRPASALAASFQNRLGSAAKQISTTHLLQSTSLATHRSPSAQATAHVSRTQIEASSRVSSKGAVAGSIVSNVSRVHHPKHGVLSTDPAPAHGTASAGRHFQSSNPSSHKVLDHKGSAVGRSAAHGSKGPSIVGGQDDDVFVQDVDGDDGLTGEDRYLNSWIQGKHGHGGVGRPFSGMPSSARSNSSPSAALPSRIRASGADVRGIMGPSSGATSAAGAYTHSRPAARSGSRQHQEWSVQVQQAGLVETLPSAAMGGVTAHMRAASASLRKYSTKPGISAISSVAITFARKPKAPYKDDARVPTPSERIANNFTPSARGLSPRTLEYMSPGGVKPGALGPLPRSVDWEVVDDREELSGMPEADGVVTAARKRMAFMPLELFDNLLYEIHTPEEWMQQERDQNGGVPADTLLYLIKDDAYSWSPCSVMSWDEESRSFEVIMDGGKPKTVKRLNLRFKCEDPCLFEQRVLEARKERACAEEELRYFFYLDSLSKDEEVIHTYNFHTNLGKAALQVPNLSPQVLEVVGRVLLEDAIDFYERAVRTAILEYRRMDHMEEGRLKVLRLPPPFQRPAAPAFGMLPLNPLSGWTLGTDPYHCERPLGLVSCPFHHLLDWAQADLFPAVPAVLSSMLKLEIICECVKKQLMWCLTPVTEDFKVVVGASDFSASEAGKPPFPLARFEAFQYSHQRQVLRYLNLKLMQAYNVLEDEELVAALNNGVAVEIEAPRSEALICLLRLAKMKLEDAVHIQLLATAEAYCSSLISYQSVEPVTLDSASLFHGVPEIFSSGALLRVALEEIPYQPPVEEPTADLVKRSGEGDEEEGEDEEAAELADDTELTHPVHVAVAPESDGEVSSPPLPLPARIRLVPSREEVLDVAAGLFDDMFKTVEEVLEPFTGSPFEDKPLCDPTAWKEDVRLERCRKTVHEVVDRAIEKFEQVASLFSAAAEALAVDITKVLQKLEPLSTPLSEYTSQIGRFKAAAAAASAAAPNEVWTGLLYVDTVPLKQALVKRAEDMVEQLLNQLQVKSRECYNQVCNRCEALCEEIMVKAEDAKGVFALKVFIERSEAEVEDMRRQIILSRERDAFRVAYRHPTDEWDTNLALEAMCWPKEIAQVFEVAWDKVEEEHFKFQDKLKVDRAQLAQGLEATTVAVEKYKNAVKVVDLMDLADHGSSLQKKLASFEEMAEHINEDERLFGWNVTEWPQISELVKEVEPFASLWQIAYEHSMKNEDWMYGNAQALNSDDLDDTVTDWYKKMQRLSKSMPLVEQRNVAEGLRVKLEQFKTYIPIVASVCNPGMRARHWESLSNLLGGSVKVKPGPDLCLSKLIKAGIMDKLEALQDLSDNASREYSLEKQLDVMQSEWSNIKFELSPWKNTGGFILKGQPVEEAQLLLDDHTIKSQAMISSPAAQAFMERIDAWVKKLVSMQDIFDAWLTCQQKWMYLGPVYGSEEIAKQMPKERYEFQGADSKWRKIMSTVEQVPLVVQVTDTEGLLPDLVAINKAFDVIEKSLNAYLDSKKMLFPRFFFLSNDELIEILSEAKDPLNVQPFVKKIFEAVESFEFSPELEISALISIEGERIPMDKAVDTKGEANGVERWLLKTEETMHKSLASISSKAFKDYPQNKRGSWILSWPGQVVIAVGQTYWTAAVTSAITEEETQGLIKLAVQNTEDLMQEVMLVRGELTSLQRATLGALVVVDVHARDVVQEMVDDEVSTIDDFSWQSRLRYYFEGGTLLVRMLNAEAVYGYEYLGNSSRLVITPLTDRCYRTLLGAHHLNLGGAPAGPAGTGKTETTKDLAKAVAIQCVVFNCSDGLDYIAMGKFFKGLAASGAWACFDEFNRIELEVLSVVAQQVLTIQRAKASGKKRFVFEGSDLPLVHTCNVYITMNPGYAGRSELPDNLKALFRDVAMMVPDYAMIAEIMLYSYGYMDARSLAQKLVQTYRLCSEQLSRQDHYDYGMRAVMAVLRAAGNLKRKLPDQKEDVLMLRAITDVNLPKFLDEDVPLFEGILSDLFPGVQLPAIDYLDITEALTANAIKAGLQPLPSFIEKAIQLYEMVVVRHGLMLVGQSFGMKTSCIRVLAAALTDMQAAGKGEMKTKVATLNPKSVTLGQLYGQDDPVSKEWSDGVLAVAFRVFARDTSPVRKWLVLDGPVDAIWIENMNTVLDDNKKLCLNSGEIIAMQGLMNMIFEVADLAVASPATVSRCGMVYLQPSLLGWRPVVLSWLQTLPEDIITDKLKQHILTLLDWLVPPLLRVVIKDCKQPVPMQEANLVMSLVRLLHGLLDPLLKPPTPPPASGAAGRAGGAAGSRGPAAAAAAAAKPSDSPEVLIECCLLFALVWALGSTVNEAGRTLFNSSFRSFLKGDYGSYSLYVATEFQSKSTWPSVRKMMPLEGSVYDWVYEAKEGKWKQWMDTVSEQRISPDADYSQIIVTTVDVVRYTFLLATSIEHHVPILLVGPTGTGKSVYIKNHLASGLDRTTWQSLAFNFSAQTSANMTQDIVDGKLDKRRKGVYGPPVGKFAVIFVDDLNMPQVEKYGAQPPIELLRQILDHGGWFDRTELLFRRLVDIQLVAAMGPPGGGRNSVTNRFMRHFHVLYTAEFDDASKTTIFTALVEWWFSRCKYQDHLIEMKSPLVAASIALYGTVMRELLPTPAKTHYIFNLRDLSKVFQGMQAAGESVDSVETMSRLWAHECLRVFHDRLTEDVDREWIGRLIKEKMEEAFHVKAIKVLSRLIEASSASPRALISSTPAHQINTNNTADGSANNLVVPVPALEVGIAQLKLITFGDFMTPGVEPKRYSEIIDPSKMASIISDYLRELNAGSKKPLQLVLFQYALEHVARICRVIKQPGGHALLVGVGGSGRQSLAQLAAFMQEYDVFQIQISSGYTMTDWHDDLKAAIRHAGEKHKPCVFLFADSQILDETMVEDISNLLNTGEVPNLFDTGEALSIGEAVRSRAKQVKMDGSRADLYNFFVSEVRKNLHVVLCFSPVGDAFRERLRRFPSLITCTTIDWFPVWPDDALKHVADQALTGVAFNDDGESLRAAVSQQCMQFHRSTRVLSERYQKEARRFFYVTPTSYLQLLESFRTLLQKRQGQVTSARQRYEVGLQKLLGTESEVKVMQQELEALAPRLVASTVETEELLVVIQTQTAEADKVKAVVQADEATAQEEASKVSAIKSECEADLAQAMPAFNAALKALDTLTKNDISEVKGMKSPPNPVKLVMEAVCILKGLRPTKVKDVDTGKYSMDYWETSKKMLSDMGFLDSLRSYDKDNIPSEVIAALKPLLKHPDFQPEKIKKVSQAAFGICSWVRAMETYDRVAKVVGPKKEALKEAEAKLKVVQAALDAKQQELAKVVAKLADLDAQLAAANARKEKLQSDVKICEEKLDRAQKLIGGLGGEKTRWTQAAQDLADVSHKLIGDMLLSAGVIAYLGPFTAEFRAQALSTWTEEVAQKGIPCSVSFSLIHALGDPVQMQAWAICGLPKDDVSATNGIVVFEGQRWPLCIDPQGQANKWVRNMEASRQLLVVKPSASDYLRQLAAALPLGRPVLLEAVPESLDASLVPVLLKQTFKMSGTMCVKLGDQIVDWHPDFRLYITTKLRNPHYPPEACTQVCLLNFSITPTGLDDQLLGVVVARERPELEEEKNKLIALGAENARRLKETEDEILRVLSASQGNILEDGEAVEILQDAKKLSDEIAAKQMDAAKTEAAIDKARTGYHPIAHHASVLFFCVAELAAIDPMYQYSLTYFLNLYIRSINDSPRPSTGLHNRLKALQEHFTLFLYRNVCRSLFEKDKLLFAFSLAVRIAIANGALEASQLRFLVTGALSMDNPHPNPAPDWLSDQAWADLCGLDGMADDFNGIREHIAESSSLWKNLYDNASPQTMPLPGILNEKLSSFQKLLVLRCLTPDKLVPAIQMYILGVLGKAYVEPQEFKLSTIFADSTSSVPLIFVLSFGSDPMADLLKFADEKKQQVETVSLGQGQGPIAEQWIQKGVEEGFWVVLQNCHLAKSFLPRLEVICEKVLTEPSVNSDFRLWLTSYPSDIFPQSVLENGLKITNEPPKGLRAGLERIYKSDPISDGTFFEGCQNEMAFKGLVYALSFFHCVVGGRRLFGPVGWNIPYTFNENDLRISLRQLRMFLDQYDVPPLAMLRYTAGECNYGGKVTDSNDRRTLMTLLDTFYNEESVSGSECKFSASGEYVIPPVGTHKQYLEYLAGLPLVEDPEVFGLHPNANISRDLQDTKLLLDSLFLTLPQDSGSSSGDAAASGSRSDPADSLSGMVSEILEKLSPDYDLELASRRYPMTYLDSMNTVLVQELGRVNVLLKIIRSSLMDLSKAVKGLVVMSGELEKVGTALQGGKVPELWLSRSFPSNKPLGAYIREVGQRCEAFSSWLDHGPPTVFWLSGFFFTQAFLTGAKQNFARKHKIPIDLIDFEYEMRDEEGQCNEKPEDGVLVKGIFLDAAAWDYKHHALCESSPKVLFVPLPPILFRPTQSGANVTRSSSPEASSPLEGEGSHPSFNYWRYSCPLYKTSERRGVLSTTGHSTNFVCEIRLPSREPSSAHWIKRGVAGLLSLDS